MEGIVVVLKPPGMTSSDVVNDIKKIFNVKKAGHTGTLDPGAAGVLPVCIGRATRLFDYVIEENKEYIGEIAFGKKTDTQDSYGAVTAQCECSVTAAQVEEAARGFIGKYMQRVPMYSAVKYKGKKLYELARSNISIESKIREVEIHEISLLDSSGPQRFLMRISCSKGTYIRTLMEDIGRRLNAHAHLSFLLRTGTGKFSIEKAVTIDELLRLKDKGMLRSALTPVENAISHLPSIRLSGMDAGRKKLLCNGAKIEVTSDFDNASVRVYDDCFIGVGRIENGFLQMKLLLREPADDK
ncbi:MAG: tRNA pseudouridine synthase B [Firmicutes bacterium ADurb.Bin182]|nr:MAG: tRNA pseudouridine synthase B [Firmicutes bacterium ADurb.Bin182]